MLRGKREFTLSTLDQGVLSGINLGVVLLFIRCAPKEEYGSYTLVTGLVLLAVGVQTALIYMPLLAIGARLEQAERGRYVSALLRFELGLSALMALALAVVVWTRTADPVLAGGAALSEIGATLREFQRSADYLERRPGRVLAMDLLCLCLTAGAFGSLLWSGRPITAGAALTLVGGAGLVPTLGLLPRLIAEAQPAREAFRTLHEQGRWTLPGMAVSWAQNTGYSYIVALLAGTAAVAELSAARLFIMPVALMTAAWSRIYLPRAGAALGGSGQNGSSGPDAGGKDGAVRVRALARRSVRVLLPAAVAYFACLVVFLELGGERLLPPRYEGIGLPLLLWCAFSLATVTRTVATVTLYAHAAFQELLGLSVVAAGGSLVATYVFVRTLGPAGAICALAAGELLLAALAWRAVARRTARFQAAGVAPTEARRSAG